MTLRDLEQLQYKKDCASTSMPAWAVPKTKFTDKTANGLTKSVIAWIQLHNGQAERINTMGRFLPGKTVGTGMYGVKQLKGKYIPTTSTKGSSDVSATIKGRSVKIEIKIGTDKQSDNQRKYQADIEAAGGLYWLVHSFDEFIQQWNDIH